MKKFIFSCLSLCIISVSYSQSITVEDVSRIEKTLASDDMQGRAVFTPGIEKAAEFIASEFRKAGIKESGNQGYFQEFPMQRTRPVQAKATADGKELDRSKITVLSSKENVSLNSRSGARKLNFKAGQNPGAELQRMMGTDSTYVIVLDTSFSRLFNYFSSRRPVVPPTATIAMILSTDDISEYEIEYTQEIERLKLKNVVGTIPGKRNDEFVIFSAHYDHLGIGKPNEQQDSIYNGANDDASGVTAVISLARHFKSQPVPERTLIFAAFTAEESGGHGSTYFSKQYDPANVVAMFNIEMIGTDSKWGKNSAFITGYEMSDMGKILEKNLEGSEFKFYPDPYPQQQLFYRSDNATLARLGVPAHTISTSKMDSEPYYHTVDDEFETLDMNNMTEIIKAIALSSKSIVDGKDTPSRVDSGRMRR